MPLDFSAGGTVAPGTVPAPDFSAGGQTLDFSSAGKPAEQKEEQRGWVERKATGLWNWYKGLGKEQAEQFHKEMSVDPKTLSTMKGVREWTAKHLDPKSPEYQSALDTSLGLAAGVDAGGLGGAKAARQVTGVTQKATQTTGIPKVLKPVPKPKSAPAATPIHSEGPLSRPAAIKNPKEFSDQLNALEGHKAADAIEIKKRLEAVPKGIPTATWEKLYHYQEQPSETHAWGMPGKTPVTLTPEEKALYDTHIKPVRDEADKLSAELEGYGYQVPPGLERPAGAVGHVPRYSAGRTRSFGEVLEQWKQGVEAKFGGAAGRSLRKTVDAQKTRRFWKAINPQTGDETIVHVGTDGNAVTFNGTPKPIPFGKFQAGQKLGVGSKLRVNGETWNLAPATTKEIEDVAATRYTKNLMANQLDNVAKLRSAVRNAKFINSAMQSPDWNGGVAVRYTDAAVPPETGGRPWRTPKLLQFRNWLVEPRLADAIDDFSRDMGTVEGFEQGLMKIGKVMNFVMFVNPKAHIDNVFNHMMVARGLAGNIVQAPSTVRSLIRAYKEVLTAGPMYTRMLKSGLSLPYSRYLTDDLHPTLIAKLGEAAKTNPSMFRQLATHFGYPDAKTMLKRFASVPSRALWIAGDIMTLSRAMQLMEKGSLLRGARNIEQAIKETHETMPSYRVPSDAFGSGPTGRGVRELFANPAFGRFGRYQYNKLQIYANDLRNAFGPGRDIKERAEAFDRLAMLGVYSFLVYDYVFDPLYKWATGNPNAEATRSGASSVPFAAKEAIQGNRSIGDVAGSIFTPGVPLQLPMELYSGRYQWSGQPIVRDADIRAGRIHQVMKDAIGYAMAQLSTFGQFLSPEGRQSAGQIGLRALGIKSPTYEDIQQRQYFRGKDAASAARRANRMEQSQ